MKPTTLNLRRRHERLMFMAVVGAMMLGGVGLANDPLLNSKTEGTKSASAASDMQLQGKVVCLAEAMHQLHRAPLPTNHEHIYGFKTNDGKFYTLLRTKYSEALFVDKRLHEKELILKGRIFPGTQIVEVFSLRSIKNGVVQDLYYYCAICEIFTVSPGICDCCQGPTELVEKPLKRAP